MNSKFNLSILVALIVSATVAFAADDPKLVAACKADVSKLQKEITATHTAGLKSFSIDATEEKAFQTRIAKLEATLNKGGLTLNECKELQQASKSLLSEVVKMTAANSAKKRSK